MNIERMHKKRRKDKMNCCEECANAIWDDGDWSVGIQAYVEDCKQKSSYIEDIWIEQSKNSEFICPFFLRQYEQEWEITRCPICKSRHISTIGEFNNDSLTVKSSCDDCSNIFEADIPMW